MEVEEDADVDTLILIRRLHTQLTQASLAREKCESQLQIQTNLLVNCMDSIEQLQNIREGSPTSARRAPVKSKSVAFEEEEGTTGSIQKHPNEVLSISPDEPEPSPVALAAKGGGQKTGAFKKMPSRKPTMAKRGSMIRTSIITAADAINMGEKKEQAGKKKWGRVRSIFLKPGGEGDRNSFLTKLKEAQSSKITSKSNVQTMIDSLGEEGGPSQEEKEEEETKEKQETERRKSKKKSYFRSIFGDWNKVNPGNSGRNKKRGSLDAVLKDSSVGAVGEWQAKKKKSTFRIKKKAKKETGEKISTWEQFMQGVKGERKKVEAQQGETGAWKLWEGWIENQEVIDLEPYQFDPRGRFLKLWNTTVFLMAIYTSFMVPYRLAFHSASYASSLNPFDVAIDVAYIMDIIVKCLTPYEDTGHNVITEEASILGHYMARTFLYDGLCAVPLDLVLSCGISFSATVVVVIFRVIRISKLLYLLRYMDLSVYNVSLRDIPKIDPVLLRLMKLIFFLALFLHWVSCIAIHVSDIDRDEIVPLPGGGEAYAIDLWLGVSDFADEGDRLRYCLCLYFTFVTMIGEKTSPQTERQVITTIVMLVCGLVTYVSIVGNLVSLINQIDSSSSAYNQKRDQLAMYMNSRNFPPKLRHRINRYFHYLHEKNKGIDDATMIEDLPPYLRKEVALFLNRNIIVKVPMFRGLSITFITALVIRLKPLLCLEDDYIIRDGEVGNEMYFLLKGHVQVMDPEGGIIASLPAGSFFGEMALVYNEKRNASVRSSNTCELLVLTRKAFEEVMQQFPDEATVITQYARERYKETNVTAKNVKTAVKTKSHEDIRKERMRRSSIDQMIWGSEEEVGGENIEGYESILAIQQSSKTKSAQKVTETSVTPILQEPEEPEDPISVGDG
ncbi:cyclic nucleotide-binding domain-containing protein [Chloropicon primus]|nr:cyclic nucleotide-binding domain-containing protein [Chloropicon primus]